MFDRDAWFSLDKTQKRDMTSEQLKILMSIDNKDHPLYNKKEQGKLSQIRKETTDLIVQAIETESDRV